MKTKIIGMALLSILASSCVTIPEKPVSAVTEIPVPVACVKNIPVAPVLIHDTLGPDYPIDVLYKSALLDLTALKQYAGALNVEVTACSKIPGSDSVVIKDKDTTTPAAQDKQHSLLQDIKDFAKRGPK